MVYFMVGVLVGFLINGRLWYDLFLYKLDVETQTKDEMLDNWKQDNFL